MGDLAFDLQKLADKNVIKSQGSLVTYSPSMSHIENCVKANGNYITIDDVSVDELNLAKELILKYNPEGLSVEEYRKAYSKNELPWQQE